MVSDLCGGDLKTTKPSGSPPGGFMLCGSAFFPRLQPLLDAGSAVNNIAPDARHGRTLAVFLPSDQREFAIRPAAQAVAQLGSQCLSWDVVGSNLDAGHCFASSG